MKKWLFTISFSIVISTFTQAADKIAVIDMSNLFQQVAQKTGVIKILEGEFKDRANELQLMEYDLQSKIQLLQHDSAAIKASDRMKLEKDVISQRQTFSQKAQNFEKDRQRRSNEERSKILKRIQNAVQYVANNQDIDLVINTNSIAFNSKSVKDITDDVLKQVK